MKPEEHGTSTSGKSLADTFHDLISTAIDAEGVYPQQAIGINHGGRMTMMALDLSGEATLHLMRGEVAKGIYQELIFGVDCYTKPGQGTTLADVIVSGWWSAATGWRIGIIEYQHEPRIVKPWCWDNGHWVAKLRPLFPAVDASAPGEAHVH